MLAAKLFAVTVTVSVSAAPGFENPKPLSLSIQEKNAATQSYVYMATRCVARAVAADTRFRKDDPSHNLGDLIEASMPKCIEPMRAMMNAFDLYFGAGMGERYFSGPYLDALPSIVVKAIPNLGE